jgi:hypothetical protein
VNGWPVSHTVLAENGSIRAKTIPQLVRQDDHRRTRRADLITSEAATQCRAHTEQIEHVR